MSDFELSPKSVVRDLYERAMTFGEFIAFYKLARSEGVVLRYLSDAYRALGRRFRPSSRNDDLRDLIEWLGELVQPGRLEPPRRVGGARASGCGRGTRPRRSRSRRLRRSNVTTNRRAFLVLVRNELFRRVQLAALDKFEELGALEAEAATLRSDAGGAASAAAVRASARSTGRMRSSVLRRARRDRHRGADARSSAMIIVDETPAAAEGVWRVRQIFADPAGDHDWGISADVDLAASAEAGVAVIRVRAVDRL